MAAQHDTAQGWLTCMLCARATTGARTDGADRGPISIDGEMRWASCRADRRRLRCRTDREGEQRGDLPKSRSSAFLQAGQLKSAAALIQPLPRCHPLTTPPPFDEYRRRPSQESTNNLGRPSLEKVNRTGNSTR